LTAQLRIGEPSELLFKLAKLDIPIEKLVKGKKPVSPKGLKVNQWKNTVYIQKRPEPYGAPRSERQRAWVENFKQLACWSKQPDPYAFQRATDLARGTNWYYRDVIESALSGKLILGEGGLRITTPTVRVSRSAAEAISGGGGTVLTPDTELWDNNNFWSPSVNPSRITFRAPGLYLVGAETLYNSVAAGYRQSFIRLNGSTIIGQMRGGNGSQADLVIQPSTLYYFDPNDYIQVLAGTTTAGITCKLNSLWAVAITPEQLL